MCECLKTIDFMMDYEYQTKNEEIYRLEYIVSEIYIISIRFHKISFVCEYLSKQAKMNRFLEKHFRIGKCCIDVNDKRHTLFDIRVEAGAASWKNVNPKLRGYIANIAFNTDISALKRNSLMRFWWHFCDFIVYCSLQMLGKSRITFFFFLNFIFSFLNFIIYDDAV
jgi:hypothetical protein